MNTGLGMRPEPCVIQGGPALYVVQGGLRGLRFRNAESGLRNE